MCAGTCPHRRGSSRARGVASGRSGRGHACLGREGKGGSREDSESCVTGGSNRGDRKGLESPASTQAGGPWFWASGVADASLAAPEQAHQCCRLPPPARTLFSLPALFPFARAHTRMHRRSPLHLTPHAITMRHPPPSPRRSLPCRTRSPCRSCWTPRTSPPSPRCAHFVRKVDSLMNGVGQLCAAARLFSYTWHSSALWFCLGVRRPTADVRRCCGLGGQQRLAGRVRRGRGDSSRSHVRKLEAAALSTCNQQPSVVHRGPPCRRHGWCACPLYALRASLPHFRKRKLSAWCGWPAPNPRWPPPPPTPPGVPLAGRRQQGQDRVHGMAAGRRRQRREWLGQLACPCIPAPETTPSSY